MPVLPFKLNPSHAAQYGISICPPKFQDSSLEKEIRAILRDDSLFTTRAVLCIGCVAMSIFFISSWFIIRPIPTRNQLILRLVIDFFLLAFLLVFTYFPIGKQKNHILMGIAMIWLSISINSTHFFLTDPEFISQFFPGVLLLIFASYIFLRSNWFFAVLVGGIIQIFDLLPSSTCNDYPMPYCIANNVSMLLLNAIGRNAIYMV